MSQSESEKEATQQAAGTSKKNPSTADMLQFAIGELCVTDRKGATVAGIKKIIIDKYEIQDPNRLKSQMKIALKKGLDSGQFIRPKNSQDLPGVMTGRYKLGKPTKAKSETMKAKKQKINKKSYKKANEENGEEAGEDGVDEPLKTPPRRALQKKITPARRAHSLSPKVKKSKSKLRRSISLTPSKKVAAQRKPKSGVKAKPLGTKKDNKSEEREEVPKAKPAAKKKGAKEKENKKPDENGDAKKTNDVAKKTNGDVKPTKKSAGKKTKKSTTAK